MCKYKSKYFLVLREFQKPRKGMEQTGSYPASMKSSSQPFLSRHATLLPNMTSKTAEWETSEQALRLEARESEVMRTRATGLAREGKDLGVGVSRRFWIFSCCRLSCAQVLTSRRALTFGNELKRFSSTLPMFVSVFRNALDGVYFF